MIAELQRRGPEAAILTRTPPPTDVTAEKHAGDDAVSFTSELAEDCANALAFLLAGAAGTLLTVPIGAPPGPERAKAMKTISQLLLRACRTVLRLLPPEEVDFERLEAVALRYLKLCRRLAHRYIGSRSAGAADWERLGERLIRESISFAMTLFPIEDIGKFEAFATSLSADDRRLTAALTLLAGEAVGNEDTDRQAGLDDFYSTMTEGN